MTPLSVQKQEPERPLIAKIARETAEERARLKDICAGGPRGVKAYRARMQELTNTLLDMGR